jgi:hypothetical protein
MRTNASRRWTIVSIYASLFQYRPREKRLPGEDFLSAALVDLLNRIPNQYRIEFVTDVLLGLHPKRSHFMRLVESNPNSTLKWATQYRMTFNQEGIIDVLLRVDGEEVLVVENKIGAGIGVKNSIKVTEAPADTKFETDEFIVVDSNQLQNYGG